MKHKPFTFHLSPFTLMAALLLASCSVEFSPNAQWKEIPVVYCLLDQDDADSWVRVEKCYLTEGDIYSPAQISDSINYPEGSIIVAILAYDNSGRQVDSIPFTYTTADRDSGDFAYANQPLYHANTAGRLRDDWRYRLVVRHTADGKLIAASADSIPLIKQISSAVVNKPSYTVNPVTGTAYGQFAFYGANNTCRIEWDTLQYGRLYQPIVRLYYAVHGDTTYIDLKAPSATSRNTAPTLSVDYPRYAFLNDIKTMLQGDTATKKYLKMVDIYLTVASEDYNAYRASLQAGASITQGREPYTNIDGGLGIFASRRMHLHKWMPADSSSLPNGLYHHLCELGVGIE